MSSPEEVKRLVPLALRALAELLDTPEERLPAGLHGVLENFGAACFQEGAENAHAATTIPSPAIPAPPTRKTPTIPSFPPPPPAQAPKPSIFTKPTAPPPRSRNSTIPPPSRGTTKKVRKLPPPPRLPKGLLKDEK